MARVAWRKTGPVSLTRSKSAEPETPRTTETESSRTLKPKGPGAIRKLRFLKSKPETAQSRPLRGSSRGRRGQTIGPVEAMDTTDGNLTPVLPIQYVRRAAAKASEKKISDLYLHHHKSSDSDDNGDTPDFPSTKSKVSCRIDKETEHVGGEYEQDSDWNSGQKLSRKRIKEKSVERSCSTKKRIRISNPVARQTTAPNTSRRPKSAPGPRNNSTDEDDDGRQMPKLKRQVPSNIPLNDEGSEQSDDGRTEGSLSPGSDNEESVPVGTRTDLVVGSPRIEHQLELEISLGSPVPEVSATGANASAIRNNNLARHLENVSDAEGDAGVATNTGLRSCVLNQKKNQRPQLAFDWKKENDAFFSVPVYMGFPVSRITTQLCPTDPRKLERYFEDAGIRTIGQLYKCNNVELCGFPIVTREFQSKYEKMLRIVTKDLSRFVEEVSNTKEFEREQQQRSERGTTSGVSGPPATDESP